MHATRHATGNWQMFAYFPNHEVNITSEYQSCQLLPRRTLSFSVTEQIATIHEGRDYVTTAGCLNQPTPIPKEIHTFDRSGRKACVVILMILHDYLDQPSGPRRETAFLWLPHGKLHSVTDPQTGE